MSIFPVVKTLNNKNGSTRSYLYLVKSTYIKETDSYKQEYIFNFGRIDNPDTSKLVDSIIEKLSQFSDKVKVLNIEKDIDTDESKTYGEIQIFRKLWKDLGFERVLRRYFSKTNKQVDLVEAIFAMVCNRLIAPSSERAVNRWKETVYEPKWEAYDLHHFYRALDFLVENKEKLELSLYKATKNLFNYEVDVVMFDTTTVSYWGEGEEAEEVLKYGYAKNKRNDLKQLVIGIIMDQNGFPIGHEVWEGNKSDKPAFKEVIEKIKRRYQIGKVILVADRGMVSEENIQYLEENGYEYILGVKMRQLNKTRKEILLGDNEGFTRIGKSLLKVKEIREYELWEKEKEVKKEEITEEEEERYKGSNKGKRRWVVCLNEEVESMDREKREYFRKIIEGKIEFNTAKEWLIRNGYKKYVKIEDMKISLDEEKLREEELYDGKWILITNSKLSSQEVIGGYKGLAKIERHFRDLKSEIEVGPIYHYTEKRIRGHIFVCFIALQIKVALMKKLRELDEETSYSEVMNDVSKIKAVEILIGNKRIITRTNLKGKATLAFKAVKTTIPPKVIEVKDI
ncbi:MAG: IS1634 family transposase [bacterium]